MEMIATELYLWFTLTLSLSSLIIVLPNLKKSSQPEDDLGLGTRDEVGQTFDVPTLHEVWRTAPYLYDGRARNLREMLTTWNTEDYHGITSDLTEQELSDLEIYVLSL